MPPGATDQDYHILQSPINGDGDSILLGDVGTMRLFWAGEHTTALHPSMAHGALLSGFRAAKEVIAATHLKTSKNVGSGDRPIPMTVFRSHHPTAPLQCHLCHLPGSRKREGGLFAFQRFSRQVIVHNNCTFNCKGRRKGGHSGPYSVYNCMENRNGASVCTKKSLHV